MQKVLWAAAALFIHLTALSQPMAINEFLCSNDNIVADNYGEFDDYVELINLTSDTLSLLGFYLSDDSTFTTKWPFPDTFLLPNNYLIIWCDDQVTQKGLHANFRLSTEGESVVLTSKFLTEVDKINYPPQSTNVSYGRYPDGTGAWRYMYPTPGIGNLKVNVPMYRKQIKSFSLYPNPSSGESIISFSPELMGSELVIYDVRGSLVTRLKISQSTMPLSFIEQRSGVYFISVGGQIQKLVVK